MTKINYWGPLFSVFIILLNACSSELNFAKAKEILSKERGTITVVIPPAKERFIKYEDDTNTMFDKLAVEGYVEITKESERPSSSVYDRRVYYRVRFTDKLTPFLVGPTLVKVGDIEVADIMGIKKVPVDENLRIIEFTTRFIPNAIGKIISLKNKNNRIEQTNCLFEKHHGDWRLSLMPPDFISRSEMVSPDITPVQLAEKAPPPLAGTRTAQAPFDSSAIKVGPIKASDSPQNADDDISAQLKNLSIEGTERICRNAVLSLAIAVQTVNGTKSYYVETADRTNILPYKDKLKRYGHRYCFSVSVVAPDEKTGLSKSVLCSIYKVGNEWQYELKEDCSILQ